MTKGALFISVVLPMTKYFLLIFATNSLPNILLILTDDQDLLFNGMVPMKKTERLIAESGITFVNAFVTTPVCCPSRASILTGKYAHNHGVINNTKEGGCSGEQWRKVSERSTVATYLERNGYTTFYAGKYMNAYGEGEKQWRHVPPGWHWWYGLVGNSVYYNYSLSVNGTTLEKHEDRDEDYLTNVIKEKALKFLQYAKTSNKPWFVMLCPPAPHSPFDPYVTYKTNFSNISLPKPPSFNFHSTDKHWLIRRAPESLDPKTIRYIKEVYKNRWRTLLSVDDLVESVVGKLKQLLMYDQTYIIYSSDNGYHLGEFCLPLDKRQLYEFDVRVPMIVSGPDVGRGRKVNEIVLNIDLAPTILEMAQIRQTAEMDGKSFLKLLTYDDQFFLDERRRRKNFLIEYWGEANRGVSSECPFLKNLAECHIDEQCVCQDASNNTYKCVREMKNSLSNSNFVFCRFSDDERFVEAYDLIKDPWQLNNLAFKPNNSFSFSLRRSKRRYYERRLSKLSKCRSKFCIT